MAAAGQGGGHRCAMGGAAVVRGPQGVEVMGEVGVGLTGGLMAGVEGGEGAADNNKATPPERGTANLVGGAAEGPGQVKNVRAAVLLEAEEGGGMRETAGIKHTVLLVDLEPTANKGTM